MSARNNKEKEAHSTQALWKRIFYFFPIQLLILHLKRNHLLLIAWLLLTAYVTGLLAAKYGVNYLFLYPEYLGRVDFWSYFVIGFSIGGFTMAFHIYSYVIHAHRFPFLATLARPFYKFCINNLLLPTIFIILYIQQTIQFQSKIEFVPDGQIALNVLGFLSGFSLFLIASLIYFRGTNKDVFRFLKRPEQKEQGRFAGVYEQMMADRRERKAKKFNRRAWRVETYLKNLYTVKLARGSEHYDEKTLQRVFSQNHLNASLFELVMVLTFLLIMNFGDNSILEIPGGASVILVFTIFLMILSILRSWFRGWTITLLVVFIILGDISTDEVGLFSNRNFLYGLDYSSTKASYPDDAFLDPTTAGQTVDADKRAMMAILDEWKQDNKAYSQNEEKPKLTILLCSGGGLRSALWTTTMFTHLDSIMDGSLMDRTALITGASGGMLGANYLRQSYLEKPELPLYSQRDMMMENISKDVLNPVLVSIASTDLFFSLRSFEFGGRSYPIDRAYRFEQQYLENLELEMDPSLGDFAKPEQEARIPMMFINPTITSDGRMLLVSPQALSFLNWDGIGESRLKDHQLEFLEYRMLFKDHEPLATRYTSLLRANATFPYIFPQVELPTDPKTKLMDTGIRDNFGWTIACLYLMSMKDWIEENTSGVVMLQIRDKRKDIKEKKKRKSLLARWLSPVGNVYGNFTKTHDFHHDALFSLLEGNIDVPIHHLNFQMEQPGTQNVSMSWHLTNLEKEIIRSSVSSKENQEEAQRLKALLRPQGAISQSQ